MGSPAAAAPRPITGELSRAGYTVIAVAANGKATAVRTSRGRFRLRPPASRVTLHLRGRNGRYAGPVVVASRRRGRRAILGVRAGATLGRISVRSGYGRVRRTLRQNLVVVSHHARATRGVPIGARRFGYVRSQRTRGGAPGDPDLDGVPDPLDIDDDGDLVLDNLDPRTAVRAAQAAGQFNLFSRLILELATTVNANPRKPSGEPAFGTPEIEAALRDLGDLIIVIQPGDSAELDCGDPDAGRAYCRKNGSTGRRFVQPPDLPAFPSCCDLDGDGFGRLTPDGPPAPGAGPVGAMTLRHGNTPIGARLDPSLPPGVGTGDNLNQWVATGIPESQCPPPLPQPQSPACAFFTATLQYVFATVPALVSYRDGGGNSATVSYPVARGTPANPGGPGARENPFPVKGSNPDGSGDVVLTLTLWRPQRRPIGTETASWIDIGGLNYTAGIADIGAFCPQTAFSNPRSDPVPNLLVPATSPINRPNAGGFTDVAASQPANPANTLTYTLNLTHCLEQRGLAASFDQPGERRGLALSGLAPNGADEAQQAVFFERK